VRKLVPVMVVALYLAACGTPASISGSTVKRVATTAAPDAVEVADAGKRSTDATTVSHPVAPANHPADRLPVTPVSRPAAAAPPADPDRGTSGFNCESSGGLGKIKLMCAPQ
jgi:hypothetical protein